MPKLRYFVTPLALSIALTGGCKYTGGDDSADQRQNAPEEAAPAEQQPAQKPASEAKAGDSAEAPADGDAPPKEDPDGLGEGTDVQRRLMAKAKQAFLTEDLDRAEELFGALVKTEPVSGPQVSGAIALAQIYNETDRPEKALELYDQLAERVDDIPEVQLVIARAFAQQGESTRAIEAYKKLLATQPDYVFALLELGQIYSDAGREEEATKTLYKYEKKIYALAQQLESAETAPAERIRILDVFSLVSDDRATEAVVKSLGAKEPQVRQKAATVLGETGAGEAKKVLEQVSINDPHMGVRMAAKDALKRLEKLGTESGEQIGPSFVEDENQIPTE
jgi:tetratricopeptide (TPR) repeat protein